MENLLKLYNQYKELSISDTFDFEKFNQYAIIHHSNSIEGSTLTLQETILLLDEQLTPANKPLEYTLMAIDHLKALKYVMELAKNKEKLSVPASTGSEINAMAGNFDSSKGDFRKVTVRAGVRTFMDYKKVPDRTLELVNYINTHIDEALGFQQINELAFDTHYQMVTIHPFADGNGRISRLLMNYIQEYHKMPLSIVFKDDKTAYTNALEKTREKEDINVFRQFMINQTTKLIKNRIQELTKPQKVVKRNNGMNLLF